MVKMKYMDTINSQFSFTNAGGGTPINIVYRANSLWDPNYATSSEAAMAGFLEFSQMYTAYRVHAVKMTATLIGSINAGNTVPVAVINYSTTGGVTSTYPSLLASTGNPYAVWDLIPYTGGNPTVLDNYVSIKKLVGSTAVTYDDDYSGPSTGNPGKVVYAIFSCGCPNAPASTFTVNYIVQIEFWAEWFGRPVETN